MEKPLSPWGLSVLLQALPHIPPLPGVYRMLSREGKNLYIGKAKNLVKRVQSYTQVHRLPHRLKRLVQEVASLECTTTATELEALLLEANLIRQFQPPYNILLKGRQAHSYLVLTRHSFPLIRGQRSAKDTLAHFGPFLSYEPLSALVKGIHRAFLLRSCSDTVFARRHRPCLQYHMKRCSAPCVGYISQDQYGEDVRQATAFLTGDSSSIKKQWIQDMQRHSLAQEYEKAAVLRDRLHALEHVHQEQTIHHPELEEADILAAFCQEGVTAVYLFCFRNGANYGTQTFFFPNTEEGEESTVLASFLEQFYADTPPPAKVLLSHAVPDAALLAKSLRQKRQGPFHILVPQRGGKRAIVEHALVNARQALERRLQTQIRPWERLPRYFPLTSPPQRIEIYDNSHLRGQYAFSAMVVAGPEGFRKKEYLLFSMFQGEDDYAMMREVMTRRFKTPLQHPVPDLIVLDGGKGQLSTVMATLEGLGMGQIPVVAMSKGPQRRDGEEVFYKAGSLMPLDMKGDREVLHLLQRLRDEAHRFAIHHHRKKKRKEMLRSELDAIPGMDIRKRAALLRHFSSFSGLQHATQEELARIPEISPRLARKLHDFFENLS